MARRSISALRLALRVGLAVVTVPLACSVGQSAHRERGANAQCLAQVPAGSLQQVSGVVDLKILLVEFQDVHCRKNDSERQPRYTSKDFQDLLGSEGTYVSPGMHSPDGDPVYGSMNDYFHAMSGGRMNIHAFVINLSDNATGLPIWIKLQSDKPHYDKDAGNEIFLESKNKARSLGLDVTTGSDVKLVIIYAGNTCYNLGGLNPVAVDHAYIMSELQGVPYGQEHRKARFSRIGIHCHEFAHTIGIGHSSGSRADLMCSGTRNGSVMGNAPAPLNPIARMQAGWATVIPVDSLSRNDVDVSYSLQTPVMYRMRNNKGDYFLIENRRFDQTMRIGTTLVPDYNNTAFFPPAWPHGMITQGIFVWRVNTVGDVKDPGYSTEGLVYASGRYGRTYPENDPSETDDGVPFPGVSNKRILSPWSDPRNPYTRESDNFDSTATHYTLFVPNTKGASSCGMEILSEDRKCGTFRVRFSTRLSPTEPLVSASNPDGLSASEKQRTICHDSSGMVHQVFETAGEIFYRKWMAGARGPQGLYLISDGNGGNGAPSITLAGGAIVVVWQAEDTGTGTYVIWTRRSGDRGDNWMELRFAGLSRRRTTTGPHPTIAGLDDGRAMVAYHAPSFMFSSLSRDGGMSWSTPPKALACNQIVDGPSVLITGTAHGPDGHIVFCADSSGHIQVYCAAFDFNTDAWHGGSNVSSALPSRYTEFQRPDFLVQTTSGGKVPWIVWDARDGDANGEQVIVCSQLLPAEDGRSYRILRGISRESMSPDALGNRISDVTVHSLTAPITTSLEQNYPNPFNLTTVVSSQLQVISDVKLTVYDLLGREVAELVNARRGPGIYHDTFDGTGLASGVYLCRMTAGAFTQTRRMVLVK